MRAFLVLFLLSGLLHAGEPVVDPSIAARRDADRAAMQAQSKSTVTSFLKQEARINSVKAELSMEETRINSVKAELSMKEARINSAKTEISKQEAKFNALKTLALIQAYILDFSFVNERFTVVLDADESSIGLKQFNFYLEYYVHPMTEAQIRSDFEHVFEAVRIALQQNGIDVAARQPSLRLRAEIGHVEPEHEGEEYTNFLRLGKAHWDYASQTLKYDRSWYEWSDGEDY